ncbi:MAG: hypothetical protein ACRDUB_04340 [Mycobacterium sp.]
MWTGCVGSSRRCWPTGEATAGLPFPAISLQSHRFGTGRLFIWGCLGGQKSQLAKIALELENVAAALATAQRTSDAELMDRIERILVGRS